MYIVYPRRVSVSRRTYLPHERMQVTAEGLGELHGFKIGKMFKAAFKITPKSFRLSNILGGVASVVSNFYTLGLASTIAPKTFSAHSKTMKIAGAVMGSVALAAGAVVAAPAVIGAIGPALSTAGTWLGTNAGTLLSAGSAFGKFFGSKNSAEQQQIANSITPEQIAAINTGQLSDEAYMRQLSMQVPSPNIPYPSGMPVMAQGSITPLDQQVPALYSPLADTGIQDDGISIPIDVSNPNNPIIKLPPEMRTAQASMIPQLSTTTWAVLGGVAVLGLLYATRE